MEPLLDKKALRNSRRAGESSIPSYQKLLMTTFIYIKKNIFLLKRALLTKHLTPGCFIFLKQALGLIFNRWSWKYLKKGGLTRKGWRKMEGGLWLSKKLCVKFLFFTFLNTFSKISKYVGYIHCSTLLMPL